MKIHVGTTKSNLTSHAGLFQIGEFFKTSGFRSAIDAVSTVKARKGVPSDSDIVFCMIALYSIGKPTYEAIEEYRYDPYFRDVIGVRRVPSSETLRQRIEALPASITAVVRRWNSAIIAAGFTEVNEKSTEQEEWSESLQIGEEWYTVIDSDVSVLDNSHSKKEGVSWTYKKCDGYAPMFSYIGKSGYMINNELREGSQHSNCGGTEEYFAETIAFGKQISVHPLLIVLDSGNDDKKLLQEFDTQGVRFVIKRNLRKESVSEWLSYAKANAVHKRQARDGSEVYYATCLREVDFIDEKREVRIVVVARERTCDETGQMLIEPETTVETYWTNLDVKETEVEEIYHQHGTSEQYHAELKSDLGVERLPSGKFYANTLHLLFSMVAFNLLRRIGTRLLLTGKSPGKRGRRMRLRTVLQNVIYLAGLVVSHAGQLLGMSQT
ncbi:MAG: IS1380 family transposase [Bacteroidota bacterium]